ncbi:MAG TPA: glycosyltransferase family 4 protein [Rudaea sp.]|nr:glycosyltransferase family 4 protein [Rudaea sp.]
MFSELEFQRYLPRKALSELLRDCAVIQVVCGSAAWACSAIGIGKPVSVQVATRVRVERRARDSAPSGFAGRWRKAMTPITDRLERRGLRRAEAVQVENPWMLDFVRNTNAGRELDLRYAPPGIDAKLFSPLPARDLADPYVLCVGRLDDPRKRVDVLLNAFAQLGPVNARLVLAGSSGPTSAFWRNAESLAVRDRVEYVQRPSREALIELYRNAAVFALPSDEEGFGMVLIEAMACGVPVVSTRSGGPDAIVDEGKTGFLVDREDAAAMTDRLRRLLCDRELNLAMGERARDAVEHRYTNEVCGRTFVDVWEKLAARGGTR